MRITDKSGLSKIFPVLEVLEKIVLHVPKRYTRGLKQITLLDHDYHEHEAALARYLEIEGTHSAEIELYLEDFLAYPESLLMNRFFLTWQFSIILMHEVYHHRVRGLHRLKKPKDRIEESNADRWAVTETARIFDEIYPARRYKKEFREAGPLLDKMKQGIFIWAGK